MKRGKIMNTQETWIIVSSSHSKAIGKPAFDYAFVTSMITSKIGR
jgi:hypothetical protein